MWRVRNTQHISTALYSLTPVIFVEIHFAFAAMIRWLRSPSSSATAPTTTDMMSAASRSTQAAYAFLGLFSAIAHVLLSWIPHLETLHYCTLYMVDCMRGLVHSRYGYIIISATIVVLGIRILLFEKRLVVKTPKKTSSSSNATSTMSAPKWSIVAFLTITAIFGSGAELTFVAIRKERYLATLETSPKQSEKGSGNIE
ncbi:hypothetical protein PG989_007918 [Apiospora arundinis]